MLIDQFQSHVQIIIVPKNININLQIRVRNGPSQQLFCDIRPLAVNDIEDHLRGVGHSKVVQIRRGVLEPGDRA